MTILIEISFRYRDGRIKDCLPKEICSAIQILAYAIPAANHIFAALLIHTLPNVYA